MLIDSLTSTKTYIEKKKNINIIIDSSKNNNGVINIDENDNNLVSIYDSGDTYLDRVSKYDGNNNILFYNESDNSIRLCRTGSVIGMKIDFIKGIKYFLNASREIGINVGLHLFKCNGIIGKRIFKIYSDNGHEIKNYVIDNNAIHVIGTDTMVIDDFSELIIYVYEKTNITGSDKIIVTYSNYEKIFDSTIMNEEYFYHVGFRGVELNCFEKANITQSVVKDTRKKAFNNATTSIINSVDNTLEIDVFLGSDEIDLVQYIGKDEFRVVFVNSIFGRAVIVNNCTLDNGVSVAYEKEKNKKIFTISCGNYIDINTSTHSIYGKDEYGNGSYSVKHYIYNSSR